MSFQLYKYLKETILLNDFRDDVIPALHKAQDLISEYIIINDADTNSEVLRKLSDTLEIIANKFNHLEYNYDPEVQPDVSENTFRNNLIRYKEEISNFISNFWSWSCNCSSIKTIALPNLAIIINSSTIVNNCYISQPLIFYIPI